jgi:hypothetical protein
LNRQVLNQTLSGNAHNKAAAEIRSLRNDIEQQTAAQERLHKEENEKMNLTRMVKKAEKDTTATWKEQK